MNRFDLSPRSAHATVLRSLGAFFSSALLLLGVITSAQAAGVVGTGSAASCTEAAFDAALAGGGNVTFNCGAGTTTIAFSTTKTITSGTIITGDSSFASRIVLSGNNLVRLFTANNSLDLLYVDLVNGRDSAAATGGAAVTGSADVRISYGTISGHQTSFGGCPAISVSGSLFLERVTVSNNVNLAAATGHAVCGNNTSGITASYSTFSQNTGGAIFTSGSASLENVTIAGNTDTGSGNSGGITAFSSGVVQLYNAIIANNGPIQCSEAAGGAIQDMGSNLQFPGVTCGATIASLDPLLGALASNGGPTQTMALAAGSPAIDRGPVLNCSLLPVDQRGVAHTDGNGDGVIRCDSGAYETATAPARPVPAIGAGALLAMILAVAVAGWRRIGRRT